MRILALSHSCITDVNQQLFVALNRLPGVQVALIIPANWRSEYTGKCLAPRLLPSVTFPIYRVPVAVPGHVSLHFYPALPWRSFQRFGPDLLLSAQEPWSLSHWQAGRLAKRLKIPLVFQTNQNIQKQYPPPFRWIERQAYQTAAAGLAYSEEAQEVLQRKGLRGPSYVVPYGIDLALFHPAPAAARRRSLGLGESLVLGYLGRFVAEKGLNTLVDAVARLRRERPRVDVKLLLVGSGAEEETLRRQVTRAGLSDRVVFPGNVLHTEAGDYLRCMDLFVLPSRTTAAWKEQFGRVIIEAMACGIPVVGSNSGQIPRLIEETGGGLVFQEGDDADLARQALRLLEDPDERRCRGEIGRRAVRARYTFEAVAAQMHGIFQELLGAPR